MTEQEMYEKSFQRPRDFFKRSSKEQYAIDKELGILDWVGDKLTDAEVKRFKEHYDT